MESPQKTILAIGRGNPRFQSGAGHLAAVFTDIVYNMALIRGLETNWLEFQLKLWRTMTKKLHRAAGRKKTRLYEGPMRVGRNGAPQESHLPGAVANSGMGKFVV